MDPDVALEMLRRWAEKEVESGDYTEAADLFMSLDHWMSHGGFLPEAWARHRETDRT